VKIRHLNLARVLAAGIVGATLALPLAATAGPLSDLVSTLAGNAPDLTRIPPTAEEQAIRTKAAALGSAFTGLAVSRLETVPGGFRIRYEHCDIYFSRATSAHEVHGDIRTKYNHVGGAGALGLPRTDELGASDRIGRFNEFAGDASIYWTPNTGPMVVRGDVRREWYGYVAERGPKGYPTSDGRVLGPGRAFGDFQNSVIYTEGGVERAPEIAGLSQEELTRALRKLMESFRPSWITIKGLEVTVEPNTGYGFLQSRNRLVHLEIWGRDTQGLLDNLYNLHLYLRFFSQKEADGSTTLRIGLHRYEYNIRGATSQGDANRTLQELLVYFVNRFDTPRKLINLQIPGAVNVLSFKVQSAAGIMVFLQPDFAGALAAAAIQRELNDLVK
jgi:hypothetical protein